MTDSEKWFKLKFDIETAVAEGFERGIQNLPDTQDGGRLIAYRYVLDLMDGMDEEKHPQDPR